MKLHLSVLATAALGMLCAQAATVFVDGNSTNPTENGSREMPYKTIGKAMKNAKHGDDVIVAQGVYRERVFLYGKKGDKPLTLKAAPGARPVISGFKLLQDWTKDSRGFYTTTVNFKPNGLLLNGQFQQLARYPEVGWLRKIQTGKDTFTAKVDRDIPAGTTCYIWYSWGNVFGQLKIKESPKRGSFVFEPNKSRLREKTDRIYFRNHPDLIAKHGQWTWKQLSKNQYQITLRCDTPIERQTVEAAGQLIPIMIRNSDNINISGFNVMGSSNQGIQVAGSQNVHLSQMGVFWNGTGVYFRFCKNVSIEDSRVTANQSGFTTRNNEGVTIRKCDVGHNCEDGIRITWKSKNGLIEGCRIHHQLWRGHPDNSQFYRDVDGVVIKDNLYFNGFQGIMAEQVKNFTLENNLFVGTCAVQVIWGHNSCYNITMKNNTVLFGGWGGITCTGSGFNLSDNIICGLSFQRGPHADRKYVGSNNLFLTNKAGLWRNGIDGKWPYSFDEFVKISGEQNSAQQVRPVPGMPAAMGIISSGDIPELTRDTFHLRQKQGRNFQVGDTVEVCFDGVPRTVTATTDTSITVTPPRKYPPSHGYIILNWKDQKDMVWKPQFTKKVGSSLSFEDIRLDRCTSVPLPANVKHYIDNVDALIIW